MGLKKTIDKETEIDGGQVRMFMKEEGEEKKIGSYS